MLKKTTVKEAVKKVAIKKPLKKVATKASIVKKTVAKKATTPKTVKKSTAKKSTKKPLVYAPDNASFWVNNGQILNSLTALRDALAEMQKEVYLYHVKKDQNDFAKWVEVVLGDSKLAKDLSKAGTPSTARSVVVRHLKAYNA